MTVGRDEDLEPARALLRSGQDLSGRRAELSDPDTALDLLADEAAPLVITQVGAGQACSVAGGDMGRQRQSAKAQLPPATRLSDPDPGDDGPQEWICENCGFIFEVSAGDPDGGVAPGTAFEAIPDDWVCPVCGTSKAQFAPL